MSRRKGRGPFAIDREQFRKLMEKAVPLDRTGDQRINDLINLLRDERDRRQISGYHRGAKASSDRREQC